MLDFKINRGKEPKVIVSPFCYSICRSSFSATCRFLLPAEFQWTILSLKGRIFPGHKRRMKGKLKQSSVGNETKRSQCNYYHGAYEHKGSNGHGPVYWTKSYRNMISKFIYIYIYLFLKLFILHNLLPIIACRTKRSGIVPEPSQKYCEAIPSVVSFSGECCGTPHINHEWPALGHHPEWAKRMKGSSTKSARHKSIEG